ncbi:MAG: hypothetical protein U0166_22325 [Acidobacteriota bacterium]
MDEPEHGFFARLRCHPWIASIALGLGAFGATVSGCAVTIFVTARSSVLVPDAAWIAWCHIVALPLAIAVLIPSCAQIAGYPHLRVRGVVLGIALGTLPLAVLIALA